MLGGVNLFRQTIERRVGRSPTPGWVGGWLGGGAVCVCVCGGGGGGCGLLTRWTKNNIPNLF